MSLLLNDPQKMDQDSKHTERVLNLTLEIIHLLTGEDYILTKRMSDKDKEWSRHQTPITVSPSHLLKNKRSNVQRILVITNKITELLTGEVPIRCQDITVYFSMEEWEYLEDHMDLYKDVIIEDPLPPISKESIIMKNVTEEPCTIPLSSSEEYCDVLEDDQIDVTEMSPNAAEYGTTVKGEAVTSDEEIYEVVIQQCKEEEIPVDISPDDRTKSLEAHLLLAPDYTADYYDTYGAHSITTNIPSTLHSRDLSSDPTSYKEPSSYPSQNDHQVTGHRGDDCTKDQEGHLLSPDYEAEYNNIAQYNSITTCKALILHKRDLSTYPNIHKESVSGQSHNDQVTGDRVVKIFTCTECGKQFKKKLSFYAHRRNHRSGKPFSCSECGKSFKNKSDLTRHQRIHSGVKPFSCSDCGKCFTVKSHLVDHQKIHTGEKPFTCSECGNCFARKSNLQRHQRTHTGVKAYYCSECGKSFTMKSDFIDHQKTHIVEQPFSCLQCGKCFTLKAELIGHMRIHTEEKPYTCPDCGKCFALKSALVNHQKLHSEEVCMFRLYD